MEKTVLSQIQDVVRQYAKVLSNVTRVNVEIVDASYVRVAGTGLLQNEVDQNVESKSFIFKRAMETKRKHIIANPSKDDICKLCPNRSQCFEKFEIVAPILYHDTVVGIIALIATDEKQKNRLEEDLDNYMDLLEQIADLICAKIKDYNAVHAQTRQIGALTEIINHIEQCVIILSHDYKIQSYNFAAASHLCLDKSYLQETVHIQETGDSINGTHEYRLLLKKQKFFGIGDIYPIGLHYEGASYIFIFREENQFKNSIHEMTALTKTHPVDDIIGSSKRTGELRDNILKIAPSLSTVLITGESGTGKEMAATAIWKAGPRHNEPFVAINCAAIPEQLLESELFGYVEGSFTGANPNGRIGKFELANHGTLFLDEIGDMPLYMQAKLLRVLQERRITRLGSNNQISVDIRVIAATNKNLKELIAENKFREDLYYRLNVIPIHIPPLRERIEDIEDLAYLFISKYSERFHKYFDHIEPEVLTKMKLYNWTGNVRELENTIEFMINMMGEDGIVSLKTLPSSLLNYQSPTDSQKNAVLTLEELEKREILKAIHLYGDTTAGKKLAAEKLGIGIATLYRKLSSLQLSK